MLEYVAIVTARLTDSKQHPSPSHDPGFPRRRVPCSQHRQSLLSSTQLPDLLLLCLLCFACLALPCLPHHHPHPYPGLPRSRYHTFSIATSPTYKSALHTCLQDRIVSCCCAPTSVRMAGWAVDDVGIATVSGAGVKVLRIGGMQHVYETGCSCFILGVCGVGEYAEVEEGK